MVKKKKSKWESFLERVKNPLFIAGMASLIYQVLQDNGIVIELGKWQLWVDLISYAIIGTGIYSTFKTDVQ